MPLTVFYTSVSGSMKIKQEQDRIFNVLESKNIFHIKVDISQNSDDKDLMRKLAGNKTALPPQICNGDVYCGDHTAFDNAIEMDQLEKFLKL